MEPLMSLIGYSVLEDTERSRALLSKFYREQGYTLAGDQFVTAKQPGRKKASKSATK